jgi:hypothetical protein
MVFQTRVTSEKSVVLLRFPAENPERIATAGKVIWLLTLGFMQGEKSLTQR